jgi:hypothetical protein
MSRTLRIVVVVLIATVLVFGVTSRILAGSGNPSVNGQPGVECDDYPSAPNGFGTDGFANAEARYAGSDGTASLAHANSDAAVSQYDVACAHQP